MGTPGKGGGSGGPYAGAGDAAPTSTYDSAGPYPSGYIGNPAQANSGSGGGGANGGEAPYGGSNGGNGGSGIVLVAYPT